MSGTLARAIPALLVALLTNAVACTPRAPLPDVTDLTPETARLRLAKEATRRVRANAVVKAKAPGWRGAFASADLDVVVEDPARMFIAVRSFFEQPMQILGTDGESVTMFDGTGGDGPRWFQGKVGPSSLALLLPIPLSPQIAVPMFLGRAPAEGARARNLQVDLQRRTYTIELEQAGARQLVTARLDDDVMVQTVVFTPDGRRLLVCEASDVRTIAGVPFAHRLTLKLFATDGPTEVVLEARDVELNGAALPPEAFLVRPPPGTSAQALPETSSFELGAGTAPH